MSIWENKQIFANGSELSNLKGFFVVNLLFSDRFEFRQPRGQLILYRPEQIYILDNFSTLLADNRSDLGVF